MGGDGVYYSDIRGENGWSAPIKTTMLLMLPERAMPLIM